MGLSEPKARISARNCSISVNEDMVDSREKAAEKCLANLADGVSIGELNDA